MELLKPDININFAKAWVPCGIVSGVLVFLSICILVYRIFIAGNYNWGTDFAGGTELQVQFTQTIPLDHIRQVLETVGYNGASVVSFGEEDSREVLIRVREVSEKGQSIADTMMGALKAKLGEGIILRRVDEVGPKVGRDLKFNAIIALILANVGIWIYIYFRFTPRFAPGGVMALIHDVLIAWGVYAIFNYEFSLTCVAALLTLIGYSINDTIVIYDRVRESMQKAKHGNISEVVVKSMNETLSRTILTSFTVFMVVTTLFVFSHGEVKNFALIFMVGVIAGTYSSIFVATPILVWLEKRRI